MCSVISTGPCNCSSSSGFSVRDGLAALGFVAIVGAAYKVFTVSPLLYLALVGLVAGVAALFSKKGQRLMWLGVKWLLREMWRSWTTRHDRPVPASTAVALPQPWRVALYPAGQPAIEGTLVGTWSNSAELQAIAMDRYRERTGFRGQLTCVAEPAGGPR
jgi:Zn-dependent protease with chaperone function